VTRVTAPDPIHAERPTESLHGLPDRLLLFVLGVLLFAAFRVITARNPVHAVLYLMLPSSGRGLWLLLKAEFLGITLVLVYLGAVMVLFLFVVMMLDINMDGCGRVSGSTSPWPPSWAAWWHRRRWPC
jgi:NADH:ubiquinone oxidoreductase subunit 6 (subunit J)